MLLERQQNRFSVHYSGPCAGFKPDITVWQATVYNLSCAIWRERERERETERERERERACYKCLILFCSK